MSVVDLKFNDLLELSKVYSPEYNMPELSDRVLVFDVMKAGWETNAFLTSDETSSPSLPDTEHLDETPSVKSEAKIPQAQQPEQESRALSESETKREPGSESDIESKADGTEKLSTETTSDSNNDNAILSSISFTENTCESEESSLVRQHKIFVHSSWLAVQSKYFRSLFYSGMKESNCKEVHVKISASEEDAHLKLLEAIYKAEILNGASVDELLAVLQLADKYDVKFVFKKCKYVLQTHATVLDVCKKIMHVIKEKHEMVDVEDLAGTLQKTLGQCYSFLENHWQTEFFTSLSQPCVKYLLSSNELLTQCENTVFQALMYWMETNNVDPSSIESNSTLLDAVRFDLTTIDYLYNVIRVHPIATKMPHFQELLMKGMTYHALPAGLRQRLGQLTPVARKACPIVQYSWVIKSTELPSSIYGTMLKSEMFWRCGYKFQLTFRRQNASCGINCYPGCIIVNMLEVTNQNYVPLTWSFTCSVQTQEGSPVTASGEFSCQSPSFSSNITFKSTNPRNFTIGESITITATVQVR